MKNYVIFKVAFTMLLLGLISASCSKKEDVSPIQIPAAGTGDFSSGSTQYTGSCNSIASSTCSGGTDIVIIDNQNKDNYLVVFNMPSNTSGSFAINNAWISNACGTYVGVMRGGSFLASTKGTLTKTGASSFTLTISANASPSASTLTEITAKGSYL